MKASIIIFCLTFPLTIFSQRNFAGVYEQETICCKCTLVLKPNYIFDLNCSRHYLTPLNEKCLWEVNSDSFTLTFDSVTLHFGIIDEDIFQRIDTIQSPYDALFWRQFLSQKSYHDNSTVSIEKSWKYLKSKGIVKHGEWKYFDKYGNLEKIEIYRRGKLRRIKN